MLVCFFVHSAGLFTRFSVGLSFILLICSLVSALVSFLMYTANLFTVFSVGSLSYFAYWFQDWFASLCLLVFCLLVPKLVCFIVHTGNLFTCSIVGLLPYSYW